MCLCVYVHESKYPMNAETQQICCLTNTPLVLPSLSTLPYLKAFFFP